MVGEGVSVHLVLAAELGRQLREAREAASSLGFDLDTHMARPRWVLTGPHKRIPTLQVGLLLFQRSGGVRWLGRGDEVL